MSIRDRQNPCYGCPQAAGGCKSRCEKFRAKEAERLASDAARLQKISAVGAYFSHRGAKHAKFLRGVAIGHAGLYAR